MTNAPSQVFSIRDRTDASPSRHNESTAAFLDRVAGGFWDQVRDLVEAWVANVPDAARRDIVGRLRSDDVQHASAFWELYLHETFTRSGFSVTVHPVVPGSARQPDFLVTRGEEAFYVEAKCLVSTSADGGASARKRALYDALNSMHCPNFFLQIDVNRIGSADLPTKRLRRKLEGWVAALDPDSIDVDGTYFESVQPFPWSEAGWELEFRPFPVRADARGRAGRRPLGIFGPVEAAWINDDESLRDALKDKGSAYGDLDLPLVIAINSFAFSHDDTDTMNALYGTEQFTISLDDRDAPPVPSRKPDGYWLAGSWAHQHVAGVLIGRSVAEYRPTALPTFWIHPEPHKDVVPLPVWRVAEPVIDHIENREPEVMISSLFGLPEVWPVGEAFPRETPT
ncbi:hypothetical protein [Microlunatus speluncae]|uniref:hypothetical protein n=1 Tax=Microlunatus speluncae TaxID=2594267 RepID=UPI0012663ED7|nr:hypothetical protein [Microlunatus speluncae]